MLERISQTTVAGLKARSHAMNLSRRDFLQSSAGLSALFAAGAVDTAPADAAQPQNNGGANERLNIAVIGVRGQGGGHVSGYAGRHNCVVTHICDVDSAVVGPRIQSAAKAQGFEPTYVQDLRRIMDNRDIHAVSIATPNHWHALAAIWAMQAGKDVYVEKPVSHNVSEGRRMVEAARRYNRICQTGTQIRSQRGSIEAIEFLKSGKLGRIQVARGLCYKRRASIGRANGEQSIPDSINYDLWCGPAPRRPLSRLRLHYDWHWVWDTGNGDLGNQGIHQMDVARWGLGKTELARTSISVGGRFGYLDDGETANTQICTFDYGNAKLIFEVRGLETPSYRNATVGNVFHCTEGILVFTSYSTAVALRPDGEVIRRFTGGGDHFGNFIQAVRSRRREDLKADILEGHLSSALCHLANISYRLGRPTPFQPRPGVYSDDEASNETLARTEEHLRANMVPLDRTNLIVGRRLTLDPQSETFVNDAEANRLLTREYRKGFEVPARIG
jgi:predicted dehydrogenase